MEEEVCACCHKRPERGFRGRELCTTCYERHRRAGTLDHHPTDARDRGVGMPQGMTYRQLDHWVTQGYLNPGKAMEGSGRCRSWTEEERRVAESMARLVKAGLSPALAEKLARGGSVDKNGIRIRIELLEVV